MKHALDWIIPVSILVAVAGILLLVLYGPNDNQYQDQRVGEICVYPEEQPREPLWLYERQKPDHGIYMAILSKGSYQNGQLVCYPIDPESQAQPGSRVILKRVMIKRMLHDTVPIVYSMAFDPPPPK